MAKGKRPKRAATVPPDRRRDAAIVLVLASPIAIVPEAMNRFVFGKLLLAAVGILLALLAPPLGRLARPTRLLLGAAGATLLLAALLADSPWAALAGRAQRYEGALTLTTYALAGVCGARLLGPGRSPRVERLAITTLAVVAGLIACFAVLEAMGLRPLSTDLDRPGGLLGNASDEGALAVLLAVPLVHWAIAQRSWRIGIGAAAASATVVLSASRGALVGLVVGLVVIAIVTAPRGRRLILGGTGAVVALTLLVPFTRSRVLNQSPLSQQTITGRHELWSESIALLGKHPFLGVGPSNFQVAITSEHDRHWQSTIGPADAPESPHNWILQVLSAGGLVLLVIVLALGVVLVRTAWPALKQREPWTCATAGALAGYGAALLFHLTAPGTTTVAAVLAGGLLARSVIPGVRRPAPARIIGVPVAALLSVAFLFAAIADVVLRSATQDVARADYAAADEGYSAAHAMRPWDVDLPAQALHDFAVAAGAGDQRAVAYGMRWYDRCGPVGHDGQVALDHAALLEASGRYRDAIDVIDDQLGRDRDNPLLLLRRGVLHAELTQWSAAEADLRESAAISPDSPEPWTNLATLYRLLGRDADAAAAQRKARELAR